MEDDLVGVRLFVVGGEGRNERRGVVLGVAVSLAVVWVALGCNHHIVAMPAGTGSVGGTGGVAGFSGLGGTCVDAGNGGMGGMGGHDCVAGAGAMMSVGPQGEGGFGACVSWTAAMNCDADCSHCLCLLNNVVPWMACDPACWNRFQCEQQSGCAPDQPECFQHVCGASDSALEEMAILRRLLLECAGACPGYSGIAVDAPGIDEPPTCDTSTCPAFDPNPPAVVAPAHCCTGTSACGVSSPAFRPDTCLERDMPGTPNVACPDEQTGIGEFGSLLAGCCRPDLRCGLDLTLFGYELGAGCVERSTLGVSFNDFISSMGATNWSPIPCN